MSQPRIFVTGASGLIGRAVLERLREDGLECVRALSRQPHADSEGVEWVRGDLSSTDAWTARLEGCVALLHLGASTGRVAAALHQRTNAQGMRSLVRAVRDAGIARFLFTSSIAAAYPEVDRYPYAASKRAAEETLRASTLDWTILRPTIVLGREGGVAPALLSFARKPRTPLFGDGRVRVQPIGARDVARLILEALRDGSTTREVLDVGGPDVLTFAELLSRLRVALGQEPGKFLRIPLGPAMSMAWAAERLIGPRLPVLAGQLYAFRYDSTARASRFLDARMPKLMRIDALIAELTAGAAHG